MQLSDLKNNDLITFYYKNPAEPYEEDWFVVGHFSQGKIIECYVSDNSELTEHTYDDDALKKYLYDITLITNTTNVQKALEQHLPELLI